MGGPISAASPPRTRPAGRGKHPLGTRRYGNRATASSPKGQQPVKGSEAGGEAVVFVAGAPRPSGGHRARVLRKRQAMFGTSDLVLRHAAAALPAHAGYALTRRVTPMLGGERRRFVASVVAEKARSLLGNDALAAAAGDRFVTEIACDDLDAITAVRWNETARLAATKVEGAEHLPDDGPAIVTSFHFSGGFRVFDVLRRHGLRPTFLHAPPRVPPAGYDRAIGRMRNRHLKATLDPPWVEPGPDARKILGRTFDQGGVVVALLDVAPALLGLRDFTECRLFGRSLRLPVGLLRMAASQGVPVVPYDGRVENDRRVLEFLAPARGDDAPSMLREILVTAERIIQARPWSWQAWLDLDALFDPETGVTFPS